MAHGIVYDVHFDVRECDHDDGGHAVADAADAAMTTLVAMDTNVDAWQADLQRKEEE